MSLLHTIPKETTTPNISEDFKNIIRAFKYTFRESKVEIFVNNNIVIGAGYEDIRGDYGPPNMWVKWEEEHLGNWRRAFWEEGCPEFSWDWIGRTVYE